VKALALVLFIASVPALAQEVIAQQRVEPPRVKVGEPFTRTIAITHPIGHRYELLLPSDTGDFEVLDQSRRRDDAGERATTTFTLRLSAFALGKLTLPPLPFEVSTPEVTRTFTSDPAAIEVIATVAEDRAELHDIRPPEVVPVPNYLLAWILLGAAAAAALAFLAWRWWQRPRPAKSISAPPQPLEVRARAALAALAGESLPALGRNKEYYSRLSEIVRGYLGERYGVEALECTSSELLSALRALPAPGLPRDALAEFLSEADLVKFARAQRTPDDCARALDFAYALVERTTAPPLPKPTHAARRELS
jgi:hypothetical protein